jgi:hypothetical protein
MIGPELRAIDSEYWKLLTKREGVKRDYSIG